jgi:capsular polysaccharide biosynthesis protein
MTMTAPPTTAPPPSPSSGRTGRLLRTRARWIAGTTLLVVLGTALFSFLQPPTYEATAEVVVLPLLTPQVTPHDPNMATEQSIVTSDLVTDVAARRLGLSKPDLVRAASVTVPAQTETLAITCATTDAAFSARCAQALAESYVAYKDSPPILSLPERGLVISPAVAPLAPVTPNLLLNLIAGLLIGLVLGFVVAMVGDRLDSRVRVAEDLEQRGLRVLGVVPARGAGAGDGGSGTDGRARAFGSLAAKVRSAVESPAGTARPRATVVAVTAVADEDTREAPAVASALASALAAWGERVVLVHADTSSVTGTEPAPGLLDLLAGRIDADEALTTTAHPLLRTVSVGERPPERIGVPEWSRTAALLGSSADLVVTAADPMLLTANGLAVAQGADAVVAVAVGRATTRSDVDAFVRECHELGLPLAGAALTVDTVGPPRRGALFPRDEQHGWNRWAEETEAGTEDGAEETEAGEDTAAESAGRTQSAGARVVTAVASALRVPSVREEPVRPETESNGTGPHPVPPT